MPDIDETPRGESSNSYLGLDAAIDRMDERVGATSWLALTEDDQARTLITATRAIDSLDLLGDPSSGDQALHFPVDGDDIIPPKIEQATLELALSYAPAAAAVAAGSTDVPDPVSPTPSNIKREKIDVLDTEYFQPTAASGSITSEGLASFPLAVQRLLAPFVRATAAMGWGLSAVVRAS